MLEARGNLLNMYGDALVITTNGFTKRNGDAVMGRGIAKQIANLLPEVPSILGKKIRTEGNNVHTLLKEKDMYLVSFPVKPISTTYIGNNVVRHAKHLYGLGDSVPGFHALADINIIIESVMQLVDLTNSMGWNKVLCPRFGCGAGELNWNEVSSAISPYLDDRFICVTF